jgi:outer membrane protein TolC
MNIPLSRSRAVAYRPLAMLIFAAFALIGCTTFSADGGFDSVGKQTRAYLDKDVQWTRSEEERGKSDVQIAELLSRSISSEDAVQIALLNNHALQASFDQLGISEANLVQSGRLPNPRFTLRHAGVAAEYDIEETLSFNVLSLLAIPYAHDIEKHRFAEVQDAVVIAIVQLANDTRQAYFGAVAAHESVHYLEQVASAAEASAELARRMLAAGNWNALDQAREQGFHTDAAQRLTRAKLIETSAREKLQRLMGLSGGEPLLQLADRLPDLPQSIEALPDIEQTILQNRIDLRLKRLQIDELARTLELGKATRFVNVLDAGPTRVLQGAASQPYERGYEVALEVPIFDGGGVRVRRAETVYSQAVDGFTQAAIDARSQIRVAYAVYRSNFDMARRQRDEVVPARQLIARQNLLRYNASLISVFDLLSDARSQIESVNDYIQSVSDFWTAKSQLDAALLGSTSP